MSTMLEEIETLCAAMTAAKWPDDFSAAVQAVRRERAARAIGALDRIRATQARPAPVPDEQAGEWQWVPKEPTEAMCRAAVIFANGNAVYKNVTAEVLKIEESIYSETFAAMLAAAPSRPAAAEKHTGDVWIKHDDDLRYVKRVLEAGRAMTDADRDAALAIVHGLRTTARTYGAAAEKREPLPQGWTIEPKGEALIVWRDDLGGYAATADDKNIASSILYHLAKELLGSTHPSTGGAA